jgi:hypothetical protein
VLASAIKLGTLPATVEGTTVGALRDAGDPDCAPGENTVWYRFDRHAAGRLVVNLEAAPRRRPSAAGASGPRTAARTTRARAGRTTAGSASLR